MKKSRLPGAVCFCPIVMVLSNAALAVAVSGQGTWETTLYARDFDNDVTTAEAYYDTVLNITWLADANPIPPEDDASAWYNSVAWVSELSFGPGIDNWRLPTMIDIGDDGCNHAYIGTDCGYNVLTTSGSTVYSEMASMFYDTLGNKSYYDTSGEGPQYGYGLTNTGVFHNIQLYFYWTGLNNVALPDDAFSWGFGFSWGSQSGDRFNGQGAKAWPVHDGDVGTPIPTPSDRDVDSDGILDEQDNCPVFPNPSQSDSDSDGAGDACDPCPNDDRDRCDLDSDGDGLLDIVEDSNDNGTVDDGETDPFDFDSDDDGLTDGHEINVIGSDPIISTTIYTMQCDINDDKEVNLGDLLLLQRQLLGIHP